MAQNMPPQISLPTNEDNIDGAPHSPTGDVREPKESAISIAS